MAVFTQYYCIMIVLLYFRALASQSRLAELNPYVSVEVSSHPLSLTSDLQFLCQFQVSHRTVERRNPWLGMMDYRPLSVCGTDWCCYWTAKGCRQVLQNAISTNQRKRYFFAFVVVDPWIVNKLQCARSFLIHLLWLWARVHHHGR